MHCIPGEWVHLGSTDCIQPDHVAHVKVWAVAAHTSTHSSIFSSPPLTHTPHTHPRHVAVRAHSVHLLVTVVHLFDPLISLHGQSIGHGTHGGGLASRATMTTNTFWLWIMGFSMYVSGTSGMAVHHPHHLKIHDLKLTPH